MDDGLFAAAKSSFCYIFDNLTMSPKVLSRADKGDEVIGCYKILADYFCCNSVTGMHCDTGMKLHIMYFENKLFCIQTCIWHSSLLQTFCGVHCCFHLQFEVRPGYPLLHCQSCCESCCDPFMQMEMYRMSTNLL